MNESPNTEQAIMDAAEQVFLEKGYQLATTTSIARLAGVTHAMLHYYFRTKEQIFMKVLEKNMNELMDSLKPIMKLDAPFWETLKGGISMHFDFINRHRNLPNMLYDVAKNNPELLAQHKTRAMETLSREFQRHNSMLRQEIEKGNINDITFGQLLNQILTMNVASFMEIPVLQNIFNMSDDDIDTFLENRKKEIITTLYARLYGRIQDSENNNK